METRCISKPDTYSITCCALELQGKEGGMNEKHITELFRKKPKRKDVH